MVLLDVTGEADGRTFFLGIQEVVVCVTSIRCSVLGVVYFVAGCAGQESAIQCVVDRLACVGYASTGVCRAYTRFMVSPVNNGFSGSLVWAAGLHMLLN